MSANAAYPLPPPVADAMRPDGRVAGMIAFFVSETAFFGTLVMAYVVYMGQSTTGPTPAEALALPLAIVNTIALLASSATIHQADKALHAGKKTAFLG